MKVNVLFFSVLRDLVGTDSLEVESDGGTTLGELLSSLEETIPGLAAWKGRLLLAVNGEYAEGATVLGDGDEIALMPPVQGG